MSRNVVVELGSLRKFVKLINNGSRSGVMRTMLKQWAFRYRSFADLRFDKFSKGGGNWPPLSPTTFRRRRKGKGKGIAAAILKDTGIMANVLSPVFINSPGAIETMRAPFGVLVGFGGPAVHPGKKKKPASIAAIAGFHQKGNSKLPQRKIIVDPDKRTLDDMKKDGHRALKKAGRQAGLGRSINA